MPGRYAIMLQVLAFIGWSLIAEWLWQQPLARAQLLPQFPATTLSFIVPQTEFDQTLWPQTQSPPLIATKPSPDLLAEMLPSYRLVIAEVHDLRDDEATLHNLHQELRRKLQALATELTGQSFRDTVIEREIAWLRRQPGVIERPSREETVDGLSGQSRITRRLILAIPPEVLEAWINRLQQIYAKWINGLLFGIASTAVTWIFALLAMAGLDRWTGGYRRGWIVFFGIILAGCVTAAIWSYVYLNYYAL